MRTIWSLSSMYYLFKGTNRTKLVLHVKHTQKKYFCSFQCYNNITVIILNYCFVERSKRNIKVTTLVLDTPRTKQTLQEDFCAILDPGVEEDLSREPFLQFCHTRLGEEEDFLADEDEGLQTYYDVCLKVGDARFYCNKVHNKLSFAGWL